jgi:beta-glucosidase
MKRYGVRVAWLGLCVACVCVMPARSLARATDVEQRVNAILSQMTLDEKLAYIGGLNGMSIRGIPRLGVPAIQMSDGPMGTRVGSSTAYPGGIALAATWNPALAARYGASLGRDDRARGVYIHLMPALNIYRSPLCGRNFEYLGEDPYLASCLVVPLVQNLQAAGVLATAKHFAANNQEYDRFGISSDVDERTLREIYLPAFRAAVVEGTAGCVMSAYNLLNGIHCTENSLLNKTILKGEWGFDGILMSDWGATHSTVGAANGGLDLEMPSGNYFNLQTLSPTILAGAVSMATIDDKVRRILRSIVRMGFLDRPQNDPSIPLDDPASVSTALTMARESMVLLKNTSHLLPLDRKRIRSVAVLGPNAGPGVPAGGGSSHVTPFHSVSEFDGIRTAATGRVPVTQVAEVSYATSVFEHVDADGVVRPGLQADYFANKTLSDTPLLRRVDAGIAFDWGSGSPGDGIPSDGFSVRWTGRLRTTQDGVYLFQARSDDGIRVYLNGALLLEDWSDHAARVVQTSRALPAGRAYDVRVEYYENTGLATAQFGWGLYDVAGIAGKVEVAVVCVGFDSSTEGEGFDRSFALPQGQVDLISAVAAANPNTIVVVNSGGSVDMGNWLDAVPAVIQAWYPGQEGGTALGEILFGEVNPSGKLPATFEKRWEDNPSYPYYHSTNGVSTSYTEGVFVGYRGYDQNRIEPQFCFGHGLSYTTFEYSDLQMASTLEAGQTGAVSFVVRNTGTRGGTEIAQLYIRDLSPRLPRPPKELKGFAKVALGPDESRTVTLPLDESVLSFFDTRSGRFVAEPGMFQVLVGASSRDLRLTGQFEFRSP